MYKKTFLKGLGRNIIILGLVSLFTDLSSQMVFPLIPLYLVTIGAGAWVVGLVEGAAETTASFLKILSGFWSDKIQKRKPFILAGYSLSTITKPLFALASLWPIVLIVRIAERIGKGIRTSPRDAIIAESAEISCRGKAYGFHRAMDGLGSILGAVVAFILLPILGFKPIFLLAFIPGLIAVIFAFFIREKNKPIKTKNNNISFRISLKDLPSNLKLFILVSTIFTLGHFGYAFILLKARYIGLGNETAIYLYILFYIVYTLFIVPAGIISDKIGRKPIIILGYGLFTAASFGLIFSSNMLSILIMFVIYGIFYALTDGVQRAFVVDLSPPKLRATALGTFHTAIGLVALPGGFLAGLLWDKFSPNATFIYAMILTIFSLLLFIFVKNNKIKKI